MASRDSSVGTVTLLRTGRHETRGLFQDRAKKIFFFSKVSILAAGPGDPFLQTYSKKLIPHFHVLPKQHMSLGKKNVLWISLPYKTLIRKTGEQR